MPNTLLLSDIHSNLEALRAVLYDSNERFGEFDAVCVLGDFIGYGANPNEVIDELGQLPNCHIIKGNHEAAALGEVPIHTFNPTAAQAATWTANQLTPENAEMIRKLPITKVVGDLTLCHGSPRDPIWEYLESADQFNANLGYFNSLACAFGHTHRPCFAGFRGNTIAVGRVSGDCIRNTSGFTRWFVNPGSVGQPRDGDSRAAYAVIRPSEPAPDSSPANYEVEFRRVAYDIEAAQQRILDGGLPPSLAFRLSEGR